MMSLIDKIGALVETCSYNFKPGNETDFADSLGGSWYVSPAAHGIEFLTVVPFYLLMVVYFGHKALNEENYNMLANIKNRPRRSWFETFCLVAMIFSYAVTVIHKLASDTNYFLLQPCHASAVILIIIMAWPSSDEVYQYIPQLLFNIYLHTLWGSVLALVFPDLRDHDMLGEVFNFFFEHGLILVLPFYLLTTKRYVVLPLNIDMALFSFFLYASYHSPLLHAVSLWSGYNINYTLVSPARK
ncbi:MAG: transmembrane protein [Benjaminiella poitrasii]|nr:MAG: transmembrane protein [Benjaminiella poitrasii]